VHDESSLLPMEATTTALDTLKTEIDAIVTKLEELNTKVGKLKAITAEGFEELALGGDQLHPKGSFKNPGVSCPEIKASYPTSASGYY
jgi:hypothetical protein